MPRVDAPWTNEQVSSLLAFQQNDLVHPFTCGNDSLHPNLVPTREGWHCVACDYRQTWAHDFMLAWPPRSAR